MAEEIKILPSELSKEEKYLMLIPQISSLIEKEHDLIANMSNVTALLKSSFNLWWVGFYRVCDHQLVLGPYQGPVACTRIDKGKGVCGTSWQEGKTIIVPDVFAFPGHIACSPESKSEIVVPGISKKKVIFVLDMDSNIFNSFDESDRRYLEEIVRMMIQYSHC